MTLEQAARVLAAVGARYATVENIRRDIEAGAPVIRDGTLNLVYYPALADSLVCVRCTGRGTLQGRGVPQVSRESACGKAMNAA